MARIPLVPKPSAIGALSMILFFMTFMGAGLYLSYAGARMPAGDQYTLLAVTAVVLLVTGGIAWVYFLSPRARRAR